MKTVAIIPARYKSTRFPGKPLVPLLGKPMILWVTDLSAKALGRDNVFVATEDARIVDIVESAGYQAVSTSDQALTGTDRLAEACENINADIYINVQGDEPLINPLDIINIRDKKIEMMDCVINGFCFLSKRENPENVNIPKVVVTENNKLIYMSRRVIPGYKDEKNAPQKYKKQVCIYAFTKKELIDFRSFGRKSHIEYCEDIEILRFLEMNKSVIMVETSGSSLAVDIKSDIAPVEEALKTLHGL